MRLTFPALPPWEVICKALDEAFPTHVVQWVRDEGHQDNLRVEFVNSKGGGRPPLGTRLPVRVVYLLVEGRCQITVMRHFYRGMKIYAGSFLVTEMLGQNIIQYLEDNEMSEQFRVGELDDAGAQSSPITTSRGPVLRRPSRQPRRR